MKQNWLLNKSLRFKIHCLVALFTLLLAGLGMVMLFLANDYLKQELLQRGNVIVRRLAESHSYQVSLELADELEPIIFRMMQTEQGIEYVEFVDAAGNIIETDDGQHRAQSDPSRRPPAYAQSKSLLIGEREDLEVADIRSALGERLYHFSAPVLPLTSSPLAGQNAVPGKSRVIGAVRLAMVPDSIEEAMSGLRVAFLLSIALATALGLAMAYWLTAVTTRPVVQLADAASIMARGDLNQQVPALARDELGQLADSFNAMADNLAKMVRRIRDAYHRVDQGREQIQSSTKQVLEGSRSQFASLQKISSAIMNMNVSLKAVAENVENLSSSSKQTSSSIVQMATSIEQVSGHIRSLSDSVDETAGSINEMISSIRQVDRSVELLSRLISESALELTQMEESIRQVEKNAASSHALSERVTSHAEMGMKSVEMTMGGMERIRESVRNASEVISQLGQSSEEIGKILHVIDDIAEQTNLLALNAGIIASQAGEHGKGFGVVAEEIRQLSERTALSTREIDSFIRAVQADVARAVQTMTSGSKTVEEGVRLSQQAGENLKRILDSARSSAQMAREIAKSTVEQSHGIQSINQAIGRVRDMVQQITRATSEQKAGSDHIISAVENMREMTAFVNRATMEQFKGSKQITLAIENVNDMVTQIVQATGEQAQGSEQIVKIVEFFKQINQKNLDSVDEMDRALSLLLEQTSILKHEISIFKVH